MYAKWKAAGSKTNRCEERMAEKCRKDILSPALMYVVMLFPIFKSAADYTGRCLHSLNVTNDGPVTLDVPVTIAAQLNCAPENVSFLYVFQDDIQRLHQVNAHDSVNASFIFTDRRGTRRITVKTYILYPLRMEIAYGRTDVQVEEYIPGNLNLTGTVRSKDSHQYIGTGWDTNITLEILYPLRVLQDAEFAYSWMVGSESKFTGNLPYTMHRFEDPGSKWVRASVFGRLPTYDGTKGVRYKWGHFSKEVIVKDPFFSLNVSGNTYLEHGQLLDLDISCNGSGPVDYCWKLLPASGNHTNLSCTDPVSSAACSIPILYYFRDSGDFQIAIYVSNLVSSMRRTIEVHIYDVSLRPQLSTVIIPIVCTVLVVIIIAVAVVIQMRRRASYNVETADFDFMRMDDSSAVAMETSWEYMWRTLVQMLQLRCLWYSLDREAPIAHYGSILKERN